MLNTLLGTGHSDATLWWSKMQLMMRKVVAIVDMTMCLETLDEKQKRVGGRIKTIRKMNREKTDKGETEGLLDVPEMPQEIDPITSVMTSVGSLKHNQVAICNKIKCLVNVDI
jgi:hypothetical protein